ncbi:hypothetical protein [Thiocapsa sp.]|uniref:hypothetical protein n=1 Tax=Thiocapsa sp. TaxID=2024551 RepID=UPI002B6008E3|nr:hypothetical protein [Thiocapsa sp.]HSO81737.1 hypothetical protein [Thiocapsa sp.]
MSPVFRVGLGTGLTVALLAVSPSLFAWGPSAFYPTPMDPSMPSPEQAQQMRGEAPGVLETMRRAHWQSARREWTGIPAQEGENRPDSGASADGPASSER